MDTLGDRIFFQIVFVFEVRCIVPARLAREVFFSPAWSLYIDLYFRNCFEKIYTHKIIKLLCFYHAMLDFSWNIKHACRNNVEPSHFFSSQLFGTHWCKTHSTKQSTILLYSATNLGRDCDVPRATLSSKLGFLTAAARCFLYNAIQILHHRDSAQGLMQL